jgi:hypothetical protein
MKWILVWWVIHPHYLEVKYVRDLPSIEECFARGEQIAAPNYKINFHCGME